MAVDLEDCRCASCGAGPLVAPQRAPPADAIHRGAIRCRACGAGFDIIWGVPFLGACESEDFIGLLEILSDVGTPVAEPTGEVVALMETLLAEYHAASDKARFRAGHAHPFVQADWFVNRYHEWLDFRAVSEGTVLAGRRVLDVGAGTGYGTWSLIAKGARVTALEYSPALAARGRMAAPQARWVGGLSHVLPFRDASFDVVCCNAALHHMRDIPQAMSEILRVLTPEGVLLTSGDPFRPDGSSDAEELAIFDRHPAVLGGINETVPRAVA
jgi:hypothetical protein